MNLSQLNEKGNGWEKKKKKKEEKGGVKPSLKVVIKEDKLHKFFFPYSRCSKERNNIIDHHILWLAIYLL